MSVLFMGFCVAVWRGVCLRARLFYGCCCGLLVCCLWLFEAFLLCGVVVVERVSLELVQVVLLVVVFFLFGGCWSWLFCGFCCCVFWIVFFLYETD